jgi:NADPH:quinone reductase-like Zn-dependent oxidoreductase
MFAASYATTKVAKFLRPLGLELHRLATFRMDDTKRFGMQCESFVGPEGMLGQFGLIARSAVVPELRGGLFRSPDKQESMATLTRLLETGKLRIVIDRTFPLDETAAALRYLASGQPVGRVVLIVGD